MAALFPVHLRTVERTSAPANRDVLKPKFAPQGGPILRARFRSWSLPTRCEPRSARVISAIRQAQCKRGPAAVQAQNHPASRHYEKISRLSQPYYFASARLSASQPASHATQTASLPIPARGSLRSALCPVLTQRGAGGGAVGLWCASRV